MYPKKYAALWAPTVGSKSCRKRDNILGVRESLAATERGEKAPPLLPRGLCLMRASAAFLHLLSNDSLDSSGAMNGTSVHYAIHTAIHTVYYLWYSYSVEI